MPSQDPQAQYHDYAARLDAAKHSVNIDESLRYAAEENVSKLQELKQLNNSILYSNLIKGYSIIGIVIFITHIIFYGYWIGLLGIVLLPIFYFFSKISMDREIKISNSKKKSMVQKDLLSVEDLKEMVGSTNAIIDLKIKRYQIMLLLTAIFTPLMFMSLHELIFGELNALNIALAVVLGSFFWMIYFKKDIDMLGEMKINQL